MSSSPQELRTVALHCADVAVEVYANHPFCRLRHKSSRTVQRGRWSKGSYSSEKLHADAIGSMSVCCDQTSTLRCQHFIP